MSSLTAQVDELIEMAMAVGWRVVRGAKHVQVYPPDRERPVTLPGTPSTDRSVTNPASVLKRHGLNAKYEQFLQNKRAESRNNVGRAQATAARKVEEAQNAAGKPQSLQYALATNGVKMAPEYIGPEQARAWLDAIEAAEDFDQRPLKWPIVESYAEQMRLGEWQQFMPDGIICLDPQGLLLNGQKRMHAVEQSGKTLGFWVARDVPRELFAYFDMAQQRSASDTFAIGKLASGPEMQSAIRLAIKFEEMLRGDIERVNWPSWNKAKTTNPDAYRFYMRRTGLGELRDYSRGVYMRSKVVAAAVIVFAYYADKAWPDRPDVETNKDPLYVYLNGIRDGEHLGRFDPAKLVRDWAIDKPRIPAKRESHLFVLNRYWNRYGDLAVKGKKGTSDQVSYNPKWPMPLPFHPDGEAAALANLLKP